MRSPAGPFGLSPELRAAIYHFTVFGSTGVASVYFAIWLSNRGISPDEIGVINAVPILVMLLINLMVGRLADKASDWRQAIIVLSLIAGAVPIGLWFVSGFWGILLVWTLAVVPATALIPVVDAATLRMTQKRGTDFATVRAWGTVGYTAVTLVAGPLIAWLGEAAFVPLFVGWSLARALLSLQLPLFRTPLHEDAPAESEPMAAQLREVMKPWFVLPLVGLGLHFATHPLIGGFGALLWSEQGIAETIIGPLIAISAAAEAVMMFLWTRLKFKVSARHLIIFAALVAFFRWTVMAFDPPVEMLFFLQTLHAITYAVGYFGGIYFIANWTSDRIAAEAQGFSFLLQQGIAVLALVAFGWLVGEFGSKAWLFAAVLSLSGALLALASLRLKPKAAVVGGAG